MTIAPEQPLKGEADALFETLELEMEFGIQQMQTFDIKNLIVLSQIRDRDHGRFDELKQSIKDIGLNNPPDVAIVDEELLTEYIGFVNETWGSEYTVQQFDANRRADGKYSLVVAGHTRALAMIDIISDESERLGRAVIGKTQGKVLQGPSVEKILYLQYAENIHQGVTTEREAIAIVELYRWGIRKGYWIDGNDFRKKQTKKLDKRKLDDALAFNELSSKVQDDVFEKRIPYRAGVEMGKLMPLMIRSMRHKANIPVGPMTEEVAIELEDIVATREAAVAVHIQNNPTMRKNATAARKYLSAVRATLEKELDQDSAYQSCEDDFGGLFAPSYAMVTPAEQARKLRREEERDLARALKRISEQPHLESTALVLKYNRLVPEVGGMICHDIRQSNDRLKDDIESPNRQPGTSGRPELHVVR